MWETAFLSQNLPVQTGTDDNSLAGTPNIQQYFILLASRIPFFGALLQLFGPTRLQVALVAEIGHLSPLRHGCEIHDLPSPHLAAMRAQLSAL